MWTSHFSTRKTVGYIRRPVGSIWNEEILKLIYCKYQYIYGRIE